MQGLMGDGQPWARYDDMFCGWASKTVGDHIGVGTKSGAPYIRHNKASNPFTNLKKEYKGIFWQEDIIKFFRGVTLSDSNNTAISAYKELAHLVKEKLTPLNPYFTRLGNAMELWVDIWEERFGGHDGSIDCDKEQNVLCLPKLLPVSSRSSMRPKYNDSTCAIFTIVHNEKIMLPIWLRYYMRHAHAEDIWILDHNTIDGSTSGDNIPQGVNYKRIHGDAAWMPHHFLNRQVEMHQQRLFRAGYKCVLFAESDEMIIANPELFSGGLKQYLAAFLADDARKFSRVVGYEIAHLSEGDGAEPVIDWSKSILSQRNFALRMVHFDKPLLSKVPLRFVPGHHHAKSHYSKNFDIPFDNNLILVHLHYVDKDYCSVRELAKFNGSKMRGKKDEDKMGVNIYSSHQDNFRLEKQCCLALAKNGNPVKVPCITTNVVEKIPSSWHNVLI